MPTSKHKKASPKPAKKKTNAKASSAKSSKKPAAKKTAAVKKAPVKKVSHAKTVPTHNGRKPGGKQITTTQAILGANHKQKKLDPFVKGQKEKLLQLRDAMVDSMAGVAKDNLRSRAEGSEASAFGMHQADAGSDAYDRDFALSLLSQEQDALYEIDQALKRIELGTYGICEMSGKPIMHARLEAIPFARFTVECQSQLEKQNKASRVRQSVTSLFGLTDEEGGEGEEEESKTDDTKE
jgi:DnaK suppressor protein